MDGVQHRLQTYADLAFAVRDETLEFFGRFACINAVAAAIDVAETLSWGWGALRPLAVRPLICNPTLSERVGDLHAPDATARFQRWANEEGSVRVELGMGSDAQAGEWAGHLVAIGDDPDPHKRVVMDATIEQFNQPSQGIVLHPIVFRLAVEHLHEEGLSRVHVAGCQVVYRAFPTDRYFERTPVWRDTSQRRIIRDRVLSRLR
jgi:hypothetical protein